MSHLRFVETCEFEIWLDDGLLIIRNRVETAPRGIFPTLTKVARDLGFSTLRLELMNSSRKLFTLQLTVKS